MSSVKRRFPGARSPLAADIEAIRIGEQAEKETPAPVAYLPSPVTEPTQTAEQPAPTHVPDAPAEEVPVQPAAIAPASESAPSIPASPSPAVPAISLPFDPKERKATTTPVQVGLKKQAETAILLTKKIPGHYKSWAAFVNGAVANELQRLADELNGGVPFEMNTGAPLPTGRPADDK